MMKLIVLASLVAGAWLALSQQAPAPALAQTASDPSPTTARSPYGGCLEVKGKKTGFFHTEKINGRWWLVDPEGFGYLGCGMANLGSYPRGSATRSFGSSQTPETAQLLLAKYATRDDYRDAQLNRLLSWGFNFSQPDGMSGDPTFRSTTQPVGPWMPYAFIVNVGGLNALADVFDDSFTTRVADMAARTCAPMKDNPRLVGYFTGNELGWNIAWGGSHVENYLTLSATTGGRKFAAKFIAARYANVEEFNKAWDTNLKNMGELATGTVKAGPRYDRLKMAADRDEFLYAMSKQFFGTLYREIKKADPNHMVMGSRFLTGAVSMQIARGMKGNVDVVSSNSYLVHRWPKFFDDLNKEVDAPIFITEFGYRAYENGISVAESGAIPRVVQSEQDRANGYTWYIDHIATVPYLVGTNWWWYPDAFGIQSGIGIGNYGFVNAKDEPYKVLAAAATVANFNVYAAARVGKPLVQGPETDYTVAKCEPMKMDGSPDKYGKMDIEIDYRNAYEGYDFKKSGLAAAATVRWDGKNIYLAVRVKDADVKRYNISEINARIAAATSQPTTAVASTASGPAIRPAPDKGVSPWQIDGVEFWLGHYQGVLYFDGDKAMASVPSGEIPDMEVAGKVYDDGYFYEIKIPEIYINDVILGGKFKLAIGVNDGERGIRHRQVFWPATYEWQYPDTFANAQYPIGPGGQKTDRD